MPEPARVALATCAALPEGDGDDLGLRALLGADFRVWDDPAVDWQSYDLVVIRATWDYTQRLGEFLAWVRDIGPRLCNPVDVVEFNTDKRYLAELAAAGLPVVDCAFLEPGQEFTAPAGAYVVKPTVSAGSRDTGRFGPGEEDRAAALAASIHATGRTVMVQPYIVSVDERGETALLFFDGAFSHAIRKAPLLRAGTGPTADLFAAENITPRTATDAELAVAGAVVAWTTTRFGGPPAYARVDLVERDDGSPAVLELELTEPSLFFAHAEGAAERFAKAITRRLPSS